MEDAKTCFYCSEPIEPGTTKCPFCGEALGRRLKPTPTGWGTPAKPMVIAVIGWVCIVAGVLGVFGIISQIFMFVLMGNNPMLAQSWGAPGSAQRNTLIVASLLGGVAAIVNLVAGYGLLRLRLWGRSVAIGLSIYAIAAAVLMPLFTLQTTLESTKASGMPASFMIGTMALTLIIQLIVQGLIIFFLTRPYVGAALRRAEGLAE